MFEKEAEAIAKDIYVHRFDDDVNYPEVLEAITVGVQKGAEFGYNRGLEAGKLKWHDLLKNPDDLPPLERVAYTAPYPALCTRLTEQ